MEDNQIITNPSLTQVQTVTKAKSPGRIEAGKRLAEWNKQKTIQLMQANHVTERPQLPPPPPPPLPTPQSEPITPPPEHHQHHSESKQPEITKLLAGGFAVGFGYLGYKLWKKYKPQAQTVSKKPKTQNTEQVATTLTVAPKAHDPFFMQ
jgi:hypothetical protein